jgi:hypothetical protein
MRKTFLAIFVVMLCASLSTAASPSGDPRTVAGIGPGIRYRLTGALEPSSKIHTIFFVLYDTTGKTVVAEKFTGQVPKGLDDPTFALLRDEDARAEAIARATSLIVTVDGHLVDTMPLKELLRRADNLVAMDSSSSPFVNVRPKGTAIPPPVAAPTTQIAGPKPHPHQEDVWPGCNQDDYCLAQWNYCNDNCSPWDPYNPCQACDSNWTECTGGVELSAWSSDTLIYSTPGLNVCGDYSQFYAQFQTYVQYSNYTRHQEFQYWRCTDDYGDHYTTFTTVDAYSYSYCYHVVDAASCNSGFRYYISCTF